MLKVIYRICDLRYGCTKIPQVNKRQCFLNFIEIFGTDNLMILADNTSQATIDFLSRYTGRIERTSLGNSGSFIRALDIAIRLPDDQPVYLVEDDYLHQSQSPQCIAEGLLRADYVTLYDHADKYMHKSPNPLVLDGGENTKVILTRTTHWKYTSSTTMTFATKAGTLKKDQKIFRHFCSGPIPADYHLFRNLAQSGRKLLSPIPSRSTHCDEYPAPFFFEKPILLKKGVPAGSMVSGPDTNSLKAVF